MPLMAVKSQLLFRHFMHVHQSKMFIRIVLEWTVSELQTDLHRGTPKMPQVQKDPNVQCIHTGDEALMLFVFLRRFIWVNILFLKDHSVNFFPPMQTVPQD